MSDIEDIAASVGISIVGDDEGDIDSAGHGINSSEKLVTSSGEESHWEALEELEKEFDFRYTEEDPDYVETLQNSDKNSKQPCIEGFSARRPRDYGPRRNRGRDFSGPHHHHYGNQGRGDYSHHRDQSSRNFDTRRRYEDRDGYRDRSERGGYRDRDDRRDYRGGYRPDNRGDYQRHERGGHHQGRRDW